MQFHAMLAPCVGAANITFSVVIVLSPARAKGVGELGTTGQAHNPY